MGSGFKDFSPGGILTAADVDGYLMRQGVMTFASDAARDSALSGVLDEGMVAYTEDNNQLSYYTGSAWRIIYKPTTAFTPAGSGALTTGNGVFDVVYGRSGDLVNYSGRFTLGTTSSLASGTLILNVPVTAQVVPVRGSAHFGDTSASTVFEAQARLGTSTTIEIVRADSTGTTIVSATVPFTWATSDVIEWSITYFAN